MRICTLLSIACFVISTEFIVFASGRNKLLVTLPYGTLRGRDRSYYYSYESIPYARPPTGKLRFEAPQPYHGSWRNVFNATEPPKACLQWNWILPSSLVGQEDCLTLSIYARKNTYNHSKKRQVLVFLQGGVFMFGDVNDYSHEKIMKHSEVIVVKVNYRMGALGFLSTGDNQITGNFGLKDQRLALKWIKKHIGYFGGDPNQILLLGHASGAAAAHLQSLRADFKGLARAVVCMSGVALNPWVVKQNPLEKAQKLAEFLECPDARSSYGIKKCLKSKSAQEIVSKMPLFFSYGNNPMNEFGFVIEADSQDAFLTRHPRDIIEDGAPNNIPLLISYTAQNGVTNSAELLRINANTSEELIYDLNERWPELSIPNLYLHEMSANPASYAWGLKNYYMQNKQFSVAHYGSVIKMYTDVLYRIGSLETMMLNSKSLHRRPIYGFVYDNPPMSGIGQLVAQRDDVNFGRNF